MCLEPPVGWGQHQRVSFFHGFELQPKQPTGFPAPARQSPRLCLFHRLRLETS